MDYNLNTKAETIISALNKNTEAMENIARMMSGRVPKSEFQFGNNTPNVVENSYKFTPYSFFKKVTSAPYDQNNPWNASIFTRFNFYYFVDGATSGSSQFLIEGQSPNGDWHTVDNPTITSTSASGNESNSTITACFVSLRARLVTLAANGRASCSLTCW